MFCSNCGKEIPNEAKFCTDCGAKVAAPQSSSEETLSDLEAKPLGDAQDLVGTDTEVPTAGKEPAAGVNDDSSNAETVEEPVEKEGISPSGHPHAEASNDAGAAEIPCADAHTDDMTPAAVGAETSNLKAAVAQNKKRSRRRIPMIVLVALALALATSVAFAAHYVYTNIWLPAHQEREESQDTQSQTPELQSPTYTVRTVSINVSVPIDPISSPGQRKNDTWSYPQITSSIQSDEVDNINRQIKETIEASASETDSTTDELSTCTLGRDMSITYMDDKTVCILDTANITSWGVHGSHFRQSRTYSLETGELINPWTVFEMTEDEAISATKQAVIKYLTANPSDILSVAEATEMIDAKINGNSSVQKTTEQPSSPLVITDEGLVYQTADYELGSYAYGPHAILVKGFNDDSAVGTEVDLSNTMNKYSGE